MGSKAVGPRPEPDRELARALLQATGDMDWTSLGRKHGPGAVRATKAELERSLTALSHYEPRLDGSLSRTIRDRLCTIGAKIRPDLSPDQATAWVDALMIALSDLPPHVSAKAVERAVHVPFEFPSQVETKVRELAQEHMDRITAAIQRCAAIEQALKEALDPTPRIAPPEPLQPGDKVLDDDEVHDLQRKGGMCKAVLDLGISRGFVLPDQLLPPDHPDLTREEMRT